MRRSDADYFPLAAVPLALLGLSLVVLVIALELHLVDVAYERLGLGPRSAALLLVASLLGSRFNIPVASLRGERVVVDQWVTAFGVTYVVPTLRETGRTWIAINLGGAVIPTAFSIYLLATRGAIARPLLVAAIVTAGVHRLARPVPGLGIAVPTLAPPCLAAVASLLLARDAPAVAAYVGGTLGTLVGADLLNLGRIRGLGAPLASIGGAGTFDGIFVTGILAVLLA